MKLGRSLLLLIIAFTNYQSVHVIAFSVDDAKDFLDFVTDAIQDVYKIWEIVGPVVAEDKILPPVLKSKEKRVMNRIMVLSKAINRIETNLVTSSASMISNLQYDLPKTLRMELKLDDLLSKTSKILAADQSFQDFIEAGVSSSNYTETEGIHFERHTLESFATYVVSQHPESVLGLMEQIHYLVAPETWHHSLLTNDGGVLYQIKNALEDAETNLCNVQQSPQQLIYNIYTSLQMTQLKGYTMMQFSWMLLRLYNKGNFTVEAKKSREKYLHRLQLQVKVAKKALDAANQEMWRCDPPEQIEGETFAQLTRLLQGYIVNEVDLNNDDGCDQNCAYYSSTTFDKKCYENCPWVTGCKNTFCSQQRGCNGKILDCRFVDSRMTVCQMDRGNDVRYRWVRYDNGETFGDTSQNCETTSIADSWWRYAVLHCSYCFCLCDDPHLSDRTFNLRPVTSDVEENKVVTALRLTKVNHIVHLQIQEGVLMPKGVINETSITWRPVDEYIMEITGFKNLDYHEMSSEERAIDFDDLFAPPNFVMTGVKFTKIGAHLTLEIQITPFNFTSGMLIKPNHRSEWINSDNMDVSSTSRRTSVELNQPAVPTNYQTGNLPDSHNNQFMLFTHTDIHKDVAQHTVPFIDTQIVGPQPPIPLAGAGLIHKGQYSSGGYIAPKVFTYNMGYHLPEKFEEIYKKAKSS